MPISLTPACKDLISRLLVADPSRRLSAGAALQHPWFSEGSPALAGVPAVQPGALLQYNRTLLASSQAFQPCPEVRCSPLGTPPARACLAAAAAQHPTPGSDARDGCDTRALEPSIYPLSLAASAALHGCGTAGREQTPAP